MKRKKRKKVKQTNWRLSKSAISLVSDIAKSTGMTKTHVVELCITKHALKVPGLADKARQALLGVLTREIGADDGE